MSARIPPKIGDEVSSAVSELYQKYNCNYCQEDIPGLRVKCADCTDFDLCLPCFCCGAQTGKHKNTHRYLFMNNGGFPMFGGCDDRGGGSQQQQQQQQQRRGGQQQQPEEEEEWNAREEMRLLDAVEQFGYGNWKDIANHVDTKPEELAKEEYIRQYIHGLIGKHTWREELRGYAVDHTHAADRGPLSPTLTGKLPPISVSRQEALLLGYMPHRDDYEDFDKSSENLVSQIADRSSEDEDVDVALKLAQCDVYERRLRDQVRRKRVARDFQLVARFYRENPIVQIGVGARVSPQKISSQVKAVKRGDGPRSELIDALKGLTQFHTAEEFHQFVNNVCIEKELKVRVKELLKYRENGLTKQSQLVPFEQKRFRRELKLRARRNKGSKGQAASSSSSSSNPRFLPQAGDYSIKAVLDPFHELKKTEASRRIGFGGAKKKRAKWARKKLKTGRRLLIQQGCILTVADPSGRSESTDGAEDTN